MIWVSPYYASEWSCCLRVSVWVEIGRKLEDYNAAYSKYE